MIPICMTIAGSDPSGGAGIQADLKVFHQHRVYGESVITLLTVQNTQAVQAVEVLKPEFVRAQLRAVLSDIPPNAAKTGALGSAGVIEMLAEEAASFEFPLVIDPVMISKHGSPLIDEQAVAALRTRLLPRAYLVTPNLPEASALAEMEVNTVEHMKQAARRIAAAGAKNVVVKGGHLQGESIDLLWNGKDAELFCAGRLDTPHTHGTGCSFSAAITARIAHGDSLPLAVRRAKKFITEAIRTSPGLGAGLGPTNLFAEVEI